MATSPQADASLHTRAEAVRVFNRFYTRQIHVLQEGMLESHFSLTELRVLYELAHRERPTASELSRDLGLDTGYLSRILLGFEKRGYLHKAPSEKDARQSYLSLTQAGREAFAPLEKKSHDEAAGMLSKLSAEGQRRVIEAMRIIQDSLGEEQSQTVVLRTHQPGDMGWIVYRHGALYAREYGLDERFEALVAEIAAKFLRKFDPQRERCWVAERDGEILGFVVLVKESKTVAKLRLLLVEPTARGLGLGSKLVKECVRFAREAGYRKIVLWTNDFLHAARRIYEREGFKMIRKEAHDDFGARGKGKLVSETWEIDL